MLIIEISTTDEELNHEEELVEMRSKKRLLKSGKLRTADSMVLHKVTWPNELVYMSAGQPAIYDELSIPLFIRGCLAILEAEKQHLRPIMA